MANWFKKISQEQNKARWSFSVEADVWVSENPDEEIEKNVANNVLSNVLNKQLSYLSIYSLFSFS